MKMEKKQCTKCKYFLLFECFRINNQTAQLTGVVQNAWTTKKCANKTESVNLEGSKKFVVNAKEVKFVTATNEDQPVVLVVENRFARTIWNNQFVKNVVVVPSANIKRSGRSVEAVTEDLFVSMKK